MTIPSCPTLLLISMLINPDRSNKRLVSTQPGTVNTVNTVMHNIWVIMLITPCQHWTVGAVLAASSIWSWIWRRIERRSCCGVVTCRCHGCGRSVVVPVYWYLLWSLVIVKRLCVMTLLKILTWSMPNAHLHSSAVKHYSFNILWNTNS